MIAHVVLCTLKPDLADTDREQFARTIASALSSISHIRRSSIGRRLGAPDAYGATSNPYDYVAVLEFDDEAALRRYLEHPAHAELASMFWKCCERTLVGDYAIASPASPLTSAFIS
ncbi:MAG TPA: Dabb family protein [Vicinamibacterales bacterium]|nr:Dabb family protein [Vicinamibacterales bacterium]